MTMSGMSALAEGISIFRRFNRGYTKFLGTLNEGLLDSDHTLTEARVLYELATRSTPTAKDIGEELSLDSGYLSRLLRDFERDGLLRKKISEKDGRFAELMLTKLGKSAFKKLDSLSNEHASAAFGKLAPEARAEVVRCMKTIETLLIESKVDLRPWVLRPPRPGDMGWVVHREGAGYAEQYGFDQTFEALVARIVHDFVMNYDSAREGCWIAEVEGQNVGHIFLVKHPEQAQTAKLRLLFVEASARGLGVGNALVNECVRFARLAGYKKVVLWTQSILLAAQHIYKKAGFLLVKEEPHHSFGQDLIGQEWELDLS
jgi:DNA-binding MarR family transcriptional regulator/GNAT superfamily N-acetyltransferase